MVQTDIELKSTHKYLFNIPDEEGPGHGLYFFFPLLQRRSLGDSWKFLLGPFFQMLFRG